MQVSTNKNRCGCGEGEKRRGQLLKEDGGGEERLPRSDTLASN